MLDEGIEKIVISRGKTGQRLILKLLEAKDEVLTDIALQSTKEQRFFGVAQAFKRKVDAIADLSCQVP
jgi:hypothetical protein